MPEFASAYWHILAANPPITISAIFAIFAAAYGVSAWHHLGRIETFKAQIETYKEKLNGSTPEEAQQRLKVAEQAVSDLRREISTLSTRIAPGIPTEDGLNALRSVLSRNTVDGQAIEIQKNMLGTGSGLFECLTREFRQAGWDITISQAVWDEYLSGVELKVINPACLSAVEAVVRDALIAAGVKFETSTTSQSVIQIIVHDPV